MVAKAGNGATATTRARKQRKERGLVEKTAGESGAAGKLRNKWVVWLKRESLRVAGCVFYSGLRGLRWKNLSVKQREGAEV